MKHKHFEFLLKKVTEGKGDSDKHLLTMYSIALSINAKNILELGVRNGDTTLPYLLAAKENNGYLESVDVNDSSFECPIELKNLWSFYKTDAIEFLQDKVLENKKYDLPKTRRNLYTKLYSNNT